MRHSRFISSWVLITLLVMAVMPAAAQTGSGNDETAIMALVAAMQDAVIRQDRDAYLGCVDLSDPTFASEHGYWVNDWAAGAPLDRFGMKVSQIKVNSDTATAEVKMTWAVLPDTSYRLAQFPARFVRVTDGAWRYAGEDWIRVDTEHFRIYAFPGMKGIAEKLTAELPEIYQHVTSSLDYTPEPTIGIKLYDSQDSLGASIALRLPPISGWNEPGESLKLFVEPGTMPAPSVLAHELTHFAMFDMTGTAHGNYPWWLAEGVAEEVASVYWDPERGATRVQRVREWAATGRLADWDAMSNYETTPLELWSFVYPQGYVFALYVTEAFGETTRNAWLQDMAGPMNLEEATQDIFGISFDQLDQDFRAWLAE